MLIETRTNDGVLFINLNRPEKLNSFTREMSRSLITALQGARDDDQVRAIVLTASGRGFCAGQDLADVVPKPGEKPALGKIVRECYNPVVALIRETEKPFIAAVNGVAAGAGANLAFACDFVIASSEVSFIQSFSKVGLIPDTGGTFMLPRLFGLARATAMTMLGEKLSAQRAYELGAIYAVVEPAKVLEEATKLAMALAKMPTRGLGLTKRGLNRSFENSLSEQLAQEEQLQNEAGLTDDYSEGVRSFVDRREPQFKGK